MTRPDPDAWEREFAEHEALRAERSGKEMRAIGRRAKAEHRKDIRRKARRARKRGKK